MPTSIFLNREWHGQHRVALFRLSVERDCHRTSTWITPSCPSQPITSASRNRAINAASYHIRAVILPCTCGLLACFNTVTSQPMVDLSGPQRWSTTLVVEHGTTWGAPRGTAPPRGPLHQEPPGTQMMQHQMGRRGHASLRPSRPRQSTRRDRSTRPAQEARWAGVAGFSAAARLTAGLQPARNAMLAPRKCCRSWHKV